MIDLMVRLNHTIVEEHAEEITETVEKITGQKPLSFKQFVSDNKGAWL